MVKYKIILSNKFQKELNNLYYYINYFLQEPEIAKKNYNEIMNSIKSLEYNPERYIKLYLHQEQNLRRMIVKNYIIIYKVEKSKRNVFILHIFHRESKLFKSNLIQIFLKSV